MFRFAHPEYLYALALIPLVTVFFLLIINLIGLDVGPLLMGRLSDLFKASYGVDSLRYAAIACLGFYIIAAILALLAVKPLRKSWIDDANG